VNASPVVETGRFAFVVNEGGSLVVVSRDDGVPDDSPIAFTASASSLYLRSLPAGRYRVVVKKAGYFDETRSVDIVPGKKRRVAITLRPKMAVLSVNTNVRDAEIEIESVGKFIPPIRKHLIKPGIYRINVQRRGYLSQRIVIDLKVAGKEQNVNVILQPLRIDSILSQANAKIDSGNYTGAAELTNDVLLLNAAHARANMLHGLVEFYRGNVSAATFFLRAIAGGEAVTLPVRLLDKNSVKMLEARVSIDRHGIMIKCPARFDLNFTIAKADFRELQSLVDTSSVAYLSLSGKSDFHGRPIEPTLKIYSAMAAFRPNSQDTFCQSPSTERTCATDIMILSKSISEWRVAVDGPQQFASGIND
jgi:hypothetical protein